MNGAFDETGRGAISGWPRCAKNTIESEQATCSNAGNGNAKHLSNPGLPR